MDFDLELENGNDARIEDMTANGTRNKGSGVEQSYMLTEGMITRRQESSTDRSETSEYTEGGTDPFKKKHRIMHTPPRRDSKKGEGDDTKSESGSTPADRMITWFNTENILGEGRATKKRKAKASPTVSNQRDGSLGKLLEALRSKVGDLVEFGKTAHNVHKEVRRLAEEIKNMTTKCDRLYNEEQILLAEKEKELLRYREASSRGTDVGIQVNLVGKQEEKHAVQKIRTNLMKDLSEEELKELVKLPWPDEIYERCTTITIEESIEEAQDSIVICKEEGQGVTEIMKRNPHIGIALKQKNEKRGLLTTTIIKSVTMVEDEGNLKEEERYIHKIMLGKENSQKELCSALSRIKGISRKKGRTEIHCIDASETKEIRKLLEFVFRDGQEKIRLVKERKNTKISDMTEVRRKRRRNAKFIQIKPKEWASYASVIGNMKANVETKDIMIDRITKTAGRNIRLAITAKEDGKKASFKTTLTEKLKDIAEVREGGRNKTLLILDVDVTTNEQDIRETIESECGRKFVENWKIRLSDKENKEGLKHAFVTMAEDVTNLLLSKKRIGIGWNRWRVKEVFTPRRCYKCRRVGHIANKCKYDVVNEICHRCGDTDHKISDCKNEEKCYLCNDAGHKAESMRCPIYKNLVAEVRRKGADVPSS